MTAVVARWLCFIINVDSGLKFEKCKQCVFTVPVGSLLLSSLKRNAVLMATVHVTGANSAFR